MKIFISTKRGQGERKNDFCFVPEGEMVRFGSQCDGEEVDGSCGCRRSMCGVIEGKATTTFKVSNVKKTKKDFEEVIRKSLKTGGWYEAMTKPKDFVKAEAKELLRLAKKFPLGKVLEKRGDEIQIRRTKEVVRRQGTWNSQTN